MHMVGERGRECWRGDKVMMLSLRAIRRRMAGRCGGLWVVCGGRAATSLSWGAGGCSTGSRARSEAA